MRRALLALLLGASACKDGCSHDAATTTPTEAAASTPMRWANVHVAIDRPGLPTFVIDAAVLEDNVPDGVDARWMAWKLRKIVPTWDGTAAVDVIDDEGFRSPLLRAGEAPGDTEAMLLVAADGESRIVRVAPKEPLTAHRGDSRKDAGRVRRVAKLIFLGDAGTAAVSGPAISLKAVFAGKESTWTRADLGKVKPIVLMSKDGDGERDAWSLRDLASALVGPSAALFEAVGEEGKAMRIRPAKWADTAVVPVLRANRRGRLKLVWLDAKSHEEDKDDKDDEQLRGVVELRFR